MKAANNCAKKFATSNFEEIGPYMISYCNGKLDSCWSQKNHSEITKKLDKVEKISEGSDQVYQLLQVDGNIDIDEEVVPNCLYSMNCENKLLVTWLNFFRGLNVLWESPSHSLCQLIPQNLEICPCFFCMMRSSCLRLKKRGQKGPKSLKTYEVLSQLGQFEIFGLSWKNLVEDMPTFIKQTLSLLCNSNQNIKEQLTPFDVMCQKCKQSYNVTEEIITEVETSCMQALGALSVETILKRKFNLKIQLNAVMN